MPAVTQLGYLGIEVSDVERWKQFATEILGLELQPSEGNSVLLRMDEHYHRLALHPDGADDLAYVGWQVEDEAALDALAQRLATAGVPTTEGGAEQRRARHVSGLITLSDPSGIPTEVYYGPFVDVVRGFQSPRPIGGFIAGDLGLGHIVVAVDDFAATLHFYRDLLGMRVSDFIDFTTPALGPVTMGFLHCNPRHHSVAFMQAPGRKRLSHFMLQVASVDDVGATYTMCQDQGAPIEATLGRHTNDQMLSFYLTTPSGFSVEYGWGGRKIDDATWQVQRHQATSVWGHRRRAVATPAPAEVHG